MAYSTESFRQATEQLEKRRTTAVAAADQRRHIFHSRSPEGRTIDEQLQTTGLRLFRTACEGGADVSERLAAIKAENVALQEKKKSLLRMLGLPEDYTEIKYTCSACNDSGYLPSGSKCACLRQLLAEAELRFSGIGAVAEEQTFATFRLLPGRPDMQRNLAKCREYAESFLPGKSSNLLLMGATGLGKTHLCSAIAHRVIEKGFRVVYESMQNVVNDFQYDRFHTVENAQRSRRYLNAELLILDDVGTEMPGNASSSVLYQVVNTRLNNRQPFLINTNLTGTELLERYEDRVCSRLLGQCEVIRMEGSDYRIHRGAQ